jgi:hypothetical protein
MVPTLKKQLVRYHTSNHSFNEDIDLLKRTICLQEKIHKDNALDVLALSYLVRFVLALNK